MGYYSKNLGDVDRIDCPCGWSRRPFAGQTKAYKIGSFHGTIFTSAKQAFPHHHIPAEDRSATHETYMVTDEDTRSDALIYLGERAVKAVPGLVAYVPPGVIHGGVGSFTPLILGAPGFAEKGVVEIKDPERIREIIAESKRNMITPREYEGSRDGLVKLTAKEPVLSFAESYGRPGAILVAQSIDNEVYCASFSHNRLNPAGFRNVRGPTYITVLKGNGEIEIDNRNVPVKPLDVLLLEPGTNFSIQNGLSTAIITVNPKDVRELIRS